jgi:putative transposase
MGQYAMSERHACRLMKLARSTQRYQSRRAERDAALRARPQELAARRMRFGYRRLTAMLVREGEEVNHKRVWKVREQRLISMSRNAVYSPDSFTPVAGSRS